MEHRDTINFHDAAAAQMSRRMNDVYYLVK